MGFALFKLDNRLQDIELYGGSKVKYLALSKAYAYLEKMENLIVECAVKYGFNPPGKYSHLKNLVKDVVGLGNKMGEGWLLTSEMLELAESGYPNIVCTQPFGCLPNHIVGKGMIRKSTPMPISLRLTMTPVQQELIRKIVLNLCSPSLMKTCKINSKNKKENHPSKR